LPKQGVEVTLRDNGHCQKHVGADESCTKRQRPKKRAQLKMVSVSLPNHALRLAPKIEN
jgi:hypothetical protein